MKHLWQAAIMNLNLVWSHVSLIILFLSHFKAGNQSNSLIKLLLWKSWPEAVAFISAILALVLRAQIRSAVGRTAEPEHSSHGDVSPRIDVWEGVTGRQFYLQSDIFRRKSLLFLFLVNRRQFSVTASSLRSGPVLVRDVRWKPPRRTHHLKVGLQLHSC